MNQKDFSNKEKKISEVVRCLKTLKYIFFFIFLFCSIYYILPLLHEVGHHIVAILLGYDSIIYYNVYFPYSSYCYAYNIPNFDYLTIFYLAGAFFNVFLAIILFVLYYFIKNRYFLALGFILHLDIYLQTLCRFISSNADFCHFNIYSNFVFLVIYFIFFTDYCYISAILEAIKK